MIRVLSDHACSIGRHIENSTTLRHVSISRRHAELEVRKGALLVRDLGSLNGTYVNGARVTETELQDQDAVQFGSLRFIVEAAEAAMDSGQRIVRKFSPSGRTFATSGEHLAATSLRVSSGDGPASAASRLATLLAITNALGGCRNETQLGERILDELKEIITFDQAAMLLLDEADRLYPVVARPAQSRPVVSRHVSMTIVREALRRGEAVMTTDASADPRFEKAQSVMEFSVRSAVCFPLINGATRLGALYFDNRVLPGVYTDGDLEYLGAFAAQAALALSHMQLQRQLREEAVVQANFSRFFSPATVQAIVKEDEPLSLGGEEREVTVLFADLRGFTSLGEALPPLQLAELLNEYFPQMVDIIFEHDGTLEKYIGDGLLAVWGAPVAHGDDACRATRAAKQMQEALVDLNAWWANEGRSYHIEVGIGINTGPAFAGNIGSERYLQYATIGDTTNTASRLCDAARGGEILVSGLTAEQAADGDITFGPVTFLQLKGKREPFAVRSVQ